MTSTLVLTAVASFGAVPQAPDGDPSWPVRAPGRYIVTLSSQPVASYDGRVRGLAATRPRLGRKVSTTSSDAQRYRAYLSQEQDRVAATVGARPGRRFSVSLNAFAAQLSTQQARTLQRTPGVISVTKDTLRHALDDRFPADYLKLSGSTGVWAGLGGPAKAGRGVVVGVIDTGIWPESKSFAGQALSTTAPPATDPYRPYRSGGHILVKKSDGSTFTGTCQTGQRWTTANCTTKIVGARYFSEGFEASGLISAAEYRSPRDGEGHGTHTASTAAGSYGVPASAAGHSFGNISGVAPAAMVASYKALWTGGPGGSDGGATSDIVAAIDAAVSDGVDVINYSVGGDRESPSDDPIQLAFLSAASAGIFVSAAAGNSGPDAATLDNTSPWVTTVAASTIAPYSGSVVLGNGTTYAGVSTTVSHAVGPAPLVSARAVKRSDAAAADAALCTPDTLDPAKVRGKIVVCDRGVVPRVDKSAEVRRATGLGMVLVNLTGNSQDADLHAVPTVHLNPPASARVKTYAALAGAKATLRPGNLTSTSLPYPQVVGFSSRGPSSASRGDLLKPDIAAPGASILAAVAPPFNSGHAFDFYSGTSMAAPHVAGLAALFFSARVHPHWTPSSVKSALMTTAQDTKTASGARNTDPFSQGAGEATPSRMFNPGLVYRSGVPAWLAYLEGLGVDTGTGVKGKAPSSYNAPSISVGELLGTKTVTRHVTSVQPGLFRATAAVAGFQVKVTPSVLSFDAAKQTKSFRVTLTRTTAAFDKATTGFLTWRGAGTVARSPIAVTPQRLKAPDTVIGAGAAGHVSFRVTPGVAGPFPLKSFGLFTSAPHRGTVRADQIVEIRTRVPAGAKAAQFALRSTSTASDMDLVVLRVVGGREVLAGVSNNLTANETVTLHAPAAGTYTAVVIGFSNAPGTTKTPYSLTSTSVTTAKGSGGLTVTPVAARAALGEPIQVTARWSGISATKPYLGYVRYLDGSGTVLTVN